MFLPPKLIAACSLDYEDLSQERELRRLQGFSVGKFADIDTLRRYGTSGRNTRIILVSLDKVYGPRVRSHAQASIRRVDLDRLLDKLTAAQREAVTLRYVDGYTHAEIGGLLGIATGAAANRVWAGIFKLRLISRNTDTIAP